MAAQIWLGGASWRAWRVILVAAMGEPLTDDERVIFQELTGRDREPGVTVEELWAIVGRRGGKSRAIAALAAYLAACIDYRGVLAPGQFRPGADHRGKPGASRRDLQITFAGIFADAPGFAGLLASAPTANTITLTARIEIQVRAASFRRARGFTAVAVIGDEAAFWSVEGSANPDAEVLAALRPSLATTGGILAVISSPYARRGELYATFRRDFGAAGDPLTLVVKAPSKSYEFGAERPHHRPGLREGSGRRSERVRCGIPQRRRRFSQRGDFSALHLGGSCRAPRVGMQNTSVSSTRLPAQAATP